MIEVPAVGDEFIPAGSYEEAFAAAPDGATLAGRTACGWSGTRRGSTRSSR